MQVKIVTNLSDRAACISNHGYLMSLKYTIHIGQSRSNTQLKNYITGIVVLVIIIVLAILVIIVLSVIIIKMYWQYFRQRRK